MTIRIRELGEILVAGMAAVIRVDANTGRLHYGPVKLDTVWDTPINQPLISSISFLLYWTKKPDHFLFTELLCNTSFVHQPLTIVQVILFK